MVENKKMRTGLEACTRLYSSEEEINRDQETVVNGVFDKNSVFAYLKDNHELSERVRASCLDGLRTGIAEFMKKKNICDIRNVFEGENFSDFFYDSQTYIILENRLKSDSVLIKGLCDTKEDSIYECEHIAEVIDCEYVNEVNRKKLVLSGHLSSANLHHINMSDKPYEFNE